MKKFSCYEAYTNSDLNEGRGSHVHIGFFARQADAERAVKGMGVMGCDADIRHQNVWIYESFEEYEQKRDEDLRASALARLSYEERRALGLLR